MKAGKGGGGRIVVNPAELRRGAKRLRGVGADLKLFHGRLRNAAVPAMPSDLIGPITSGISDVASLLVGLPDPLDSSAVELERRALWAEIADQMIAGVPLSSTQLTEFMAGLRDGTLVKYAEPWQAELAGAWVAGQFKDNFKDPERFVELALLLKANAIDSTAGKAFAGAFVRDFGAERMLEIPRVLQALEWSRQMTFGQIPEHLNEFMQWEYARDLPYGYKLPHDPVELLGAFSLTLALATQSAALTRTNVDEEIAGADDDWALGQLLVKGVFGKEFLLDAFRNGVLDEIAEEANIRRTPGGEEWPHEMMPIGWSDGTDWLSLDAKTLIMDALARNPEAAAAALTNPISVDIDSMLGPAHYENPFVMLYREAVFDDGGTAFARAFGAGVDYLEPEDPTAAGKLTLRAADEMLDNRRIITGEHGMEPVRDELARVIGDHYIDDLHASATGTESALDYDPDNDGAIGRADADGISVSHSQIVALLNEFASSETAHQHVSEGVAQYQTALVLANTGDGAPPNPDWVKEIGRFNGLVQSAYEDHALEGVAEAQARQQLATRAYDAVTGVIPAAKLLGPANPYIKDLIGGIIGGPTTQQASGASYDFQSSIQRGMQTAIVAGYWENNQLGTPRDVDNFIDRMTAEDGTARPDPKYASQGFTPKSFLDARGDIVPYGEMTDDQRRTFEHWIGNSEQIDSDAARAIKDAELWFLGRDKDSMGTQ